MGWLTIPEVRAHLQISAARDVDDQLQLFMDAAEQWLDDTIGRVQPPDEALVELHDGGDRTVILEESVAASIVSITAAGVAVAPRTETSAGWYATPLDLAGGLVRHSAGFPYGTVKVTYYPGRAEVAANVHLAALELVGHLWQVSQNGTGTSSTVTALMGGGEGSGGQAPRGFAIPKRVRELLKLGNRELAEVLVG